MTAAEILGLLLGLLALGLLWWLAARELQRREARQDARWWASVDRPRDACDRCRALRKPPEPGTFRLRHPTTD